MEQALLATQGDEKNLKKYINFFCKQLNYNNIFSTNSIFTSFVVSILALAPIGITVFLSICPKLSDFIIGNL